MQINKLFPDEIILKTKYFTVAQDWEVPISGFFIISPNRTVKSLMEFSTEEQAEFFSLIFQFRLAMKEVLGIENVAIFQSEKTIGNFHLWLFPYHDWMNKFDVGVGGIEIMPIINYAKANLVNDETIKEVKESVEKIKNWSKIQI
jgi:diadenosine tetraphosphate (Ap4A) HIT family hydrolase